MSDSTVSLPLQPEATQFVDGERDFGAFTTLQGRFVGVGSSKPFRTPKRHLAVIYDTIPPNNQLFIIFKVYEKCTIETIYGKSNKGD